jgi:DNA repair protein RadC
LRPIEPGFQLDHEIFAAILLDRYNRLIDYIEIKHGTRDMVQIKPREVLKVALVREAASIILVHNHPGDDTKASDADIALTRTMKRALDLVDVRLLDHFIVRIA